MSKRRTSIYKIQQRTLAVDKHELIITTSLREKNESNQSMQPSVHSKSYDISKKKTEISNKMSTEKSSDERNQRQYIES